MQPRSELRRPRWRRWASACAWLGLTAVGVAMVAIGPTRLVQHVIVSLAGDTDYAPGFDARAFAELPLGATAE